MDDEIRDFDRNKLIGLDKVADILDISEREVYRLIASGELPRPVKIRRLSKLPLSDVFDYIQRLKSARGEPVGKL